MAHFEGSLARLAWPSLPSWTLLNIITEGGDNLHTHLYIYILSRQQNINYIYIYIHLGTRSPGTAKAQSKYSSGIVQAQPRRSSDAQDKHSSGTAKDSIGTAHA